MASSWAWCAGSGIATVGDDAVGGGAVAVGGAVVGGGAAVGPAVGLGLVGGADTGVARGGTLASATASVTDALPSSSDEHADMPSRAPTTVTEAAVAATRRRRRTTEAVENVEVEVEGVIMLASMKIVTRTRRRPRDRSLSPVAHPKGADNRHPFGGNELASAGRTWASARRPVDHRGGSAYPPAMSPLRPHDYVDPARYVAEVDAVLRSSWLPVCRADQLARPGDRIAITLAGLPVIATRDQTGELHVLANVCAHRGALVVADGPGHGSTLICGYHRWAYRPDGSFVGAPLADGSDLSGACLPIVPHREWQGFVLVNPSADAPPPEDDLIDLAAVIGPWSWDELVTVASAGSSPRGTGRSWWRTGSSATTTSARTGPRSSHISRRTQRKSAPAPGRHGLQ